MTDPTSNLTLVQCLTDHLTGDELRRIAALLPGPTPNRKADMAAKIGAGLAGPGLKAVVDALDAPYRNVLAELAHGPRRVFDRERFAAKYGHAPEFAPRRGVLYGDRTILPIRLLLVHTREGWVLPEDLRERLKTLLPVPARAKLAVESAAPSIPEARVIHTEAAALSEVRAVLALVDAGRISVGETTLRPSAASVKAVDAVLVGGDFHAELPRTKGAGEHPGPIRAWAWPLLLQVGKLAEARGSKLVLTEAGRAAFNRPAQSVIRELFTAWSGADLFNELSRIEVVKGYGGRNAEFLVPPHWRRLGLSLALHGGRAGEWATPEAYLRHILAEGGAVKATFAHDTLYISDAQYGALNYDQAIGCLNLRLLLCALLETLATLGVVDVCLRPPAEARHDYPSVYGADWMPCLSRYDGLMAVSLTPLGEYCLGRTREFAPAAAEAVPAVVVVDGLEVQATRGLDAPDAMLLEAYAERLTADRWRVTTSSLLAALDEGRALATLSAFFERAAGGADLQAIRACIADAERRAAALTDAGTARVFTCVDRALAELLLSDPTAGALCTVIGEGQVVVLPSNLAAFRKRLRMLGYRVPKG
jgi:hypothetical protein